MFRPTGKAHSPAWIAQVWLSFGIAVLAVFVGIFRIDASSWARAFLAMGVLLCINSAFALAKTLRDLHEEQSIVKRVDDARVEKLIAEHDPLKV